MSEKPAGHHVSDAKDHTNRFGEGQFAPISPTQAPKRPMNRRIKVTIRQPFLPDHPQAFHGLKPTKGHSK